MAERTKKFSHKHRNSDKKYGYINEKLYALLREKESETQLNPFILTVVPSGGSGASSSNLIIF